MALVYTLCGEYDKALDAIEEVLEERTVFTVNDVKLNREFEPLRDLPRYKALIAKYTEDFGA